MIFLALVSIGFYGPIWFIRRRRAINLLQSHEKLGLSVFVFTIVAWCASFAVNPILGEGGEGSDSVFFLQFAVVLTLELQCFKTARILRDHFRAELASNPVCPEITLFPKPAILIFNIFYLQYQITRYLKVKQALALAESSSLRGGKR